MNLLTSRSRRNASALIISVAVLAVLVLLAISFARFMVIERGSSQNFRLGVQARLNAEAGIQGAAAWFTDPSNIEAGYSLANFGEAPWIYRNDAGTDVGAGMVDVADAVNPSFSGLTLPSATFGQKVNNKVRLKVIDSSSQVNLNSSINGEGISSGSQLRRLLLNLGTAIQSVYATSTTNPPWWPDSITVPNPFPTLIVDRIITYRQGLPAPGLIKDEEEIRPIVEGWTGTSQARGDLTDPQRKVIWKLVKDYITVWGFRNDRSVDRIEPPHFTWYNDSNFTWWRAAAPSQWTRKLAGLAQLMPILGPRYAININTAPKVVLIAAISGIAGAYRRHEPASTSTSLDGAPGVNYSFLKTHHGTAATTVTLGDTGGDSAAVVYARIAALAERIITYRTSTATFKRWSDVVAFLNVIKVEASFTWFGDGKQRDLFLAALNPNWVSNQHIPERHRYSSVSRLDVLASRAEFTFTPGGFFEIESLGWVETPLGERIAECRIEAGVRLWELVHRTSQRDFITDLQSATNTITGPEPIGNVLNSNMDFASDTLLSSPPYSSLKVARNGSPYEGYIQALSERLTTTRPGGVLTFAQTADSDATCTFYHPFLTTGFAPVKRLIADAAPGYLGEATSPTLWKKTGETIFRGESLAPDGAVFFNYANEEISFDSTVGTIANIAQNFRPDFGTVEFWLKFPAAYESGRSAADWGGHEALAYVTQNLGSYVLTEQNATGTPMTATSEIGVTWKLERYGFTLRSTRFFWIRTMPSFIPTIPPLPTTAANGNTITLDYLWTEVSFDLQNVAGEWNDNEWHHFACSWNDYTEQAVFVDGTRVGYVLSSQSPAVGPGSNQVPHTLDQNDADYDTRFELYSAPTLSRAVFGGLIFTQPSTLNVYHGAPENAGTTCRISNAKIDEIRCWSFHVPTTLDVNYSKVCSKKRFEPLSGNPVYNGRLTLGARGRLGMITFNQSLPGDGTTISKSLKAGSTSLTASTSDVIDGQGVVVTPTTTFDYGISFMLGSGSNSTPVLDDMTIYVASKPLFVGYKSNFER